MPPAQKGIHMRTRRLGAALAVLCLALLVSCGGGAAPQGGATSTPGASATTSALASPTSIPTPIRYTSRVILRGVGRPDDLAFDPQGRLLFSDFYNGAISRVNADGTVTVLARGLPGPEGLVSLPDGTLIVAEQTSHQIVSLAPGAATAKL